MPPGAQPLTCESWQPASTAPAHLSAAGTREPRLSREAISVLRQVDAVARTVTQLEQFLETLENAAAFLIMQLQRAGFSHMQRTLRNQQSLQYESNRQRT